MKFSTPVLFLGLLSVGLATASPAAILSEEQRLQNFIDDIINKTLSGLIESFQDPLSTDVGNISLTISGLSTGYADISSLVLTGLQSIVATEIKSNIFGSSLEATINVPQLSIDTKYDADILILELVPLYGNGKLGLDAENAEVKVSANYILSPFSIYNVTLNFDVDEVEFDVHGVFDNPALSAVIEQVLNDNFVDFIKKHHELIDKVLSVVANSIFTNKNATALPELDEEIATFKKEFEAFQLNKNN